MSIDEIMKRIASKSAEIQERFAEAYLAETGLKPSEVELCQQNRGNEVVWFFRKRTVIIRGDAE